MKAVNNFGLDREIAARSNAKYDFSLESQAQNWIHQVTGKSFRSGFGETLQDGSVLCELVKRLRPSYIAEIYHGNQPFKQMENVTRFINAARKLGVAEADLFTTVALFELKNLGQVVSCILALKRVILGGQFPQSMRPKSSASGWKSSHTIDVKRDPIDSGSNRFTFQKRIPETKLGVIRQMSWEGGSTSDSTSTRKQIPRERVNTPESTPVTKEVDSQSRNPASYDKYHSKKSWFSGILSWNLNSKKTSKPNNGVLSKTRQYNSMNMKTRKEATHGYTSWNKWLRKSTQPPLEKSYQNWARFR